LRPDIALIKEALPADLLDTARAFVGLNLAARAAEMMPDDEEQHGETAPQAYNPRAETDPDWEQMNDQDSEDLPY
jgi:hypothetical protein